VFDFDAILFDFDGVLVDSEPVHWECWTAALNPLGVDLDWPTYARHCIGITDRDLLEFYYRLGVGRHGWQTLEDAYARKKALFRQTVESRELFLPEVVRFLKALRGRKLGVVTSSRSIEVEPLLVQAGVRDLFEILIGAEQVSQRKPHPEPYLTASRRLNAVKPLVVEDSDAGVTSARAAGFDVVRVTGPQDLERVVGAALGLTGNSAG
jgi:HAD superfamily hydrolase (TIGR01509 family)